MLSKNHSSKLPARVKPGFALISVISLIVLLALVAVALLTLSNVTLRTSSLDDSEAKENAKLALMEALSEVQSTMGPDQRVSAYADLVEGRYLDGVQHNHYLGVWNGWKIDNNTNPGTVDYDSAKNVVNADGDIDPAAGGFIKWLSSGNNATTFNAPTQDLGTNAVDIVNDGTVGNTANYVQAELVNIDSDGDGAVDGGYAWHVFDESQKANITLNDTTPTTDLERTMSLNSTGKLGYDHVTDFNALAGIPDTDLEKLATYESLELAATGFNVDTTNSFFTITSESKGLLVDTTKGKFQTDLSLLFAGDTLPTAYRGNHLYSNNGTPLANRPSRFKGTYTGGTEEKHIQPLPSPDPTWDLLHSHYRLYRDLNTGGNFSLPLGNTQTNITDQDTGETRVTPLFTYGDDDTFHLLNNPAKDRNTDFENNQQILPVVSNAQFIYSLTNRWNPNQATVNKLMFVTDAVVTLWNPYNVSIDVDKMELEFYRFPTEFKFYKGTSANSLSQVADHYTNVANMHNSNNIVGVTANATWELRNIAPIRVRITGERLAPGEFRVFGPTDFNENTSDIINQNGNISPNSPISNFGSNNVSHGMVLTNSFDETAGGSYTAVLVVDGDGNAPSSTSSVSISVAAGEYASVAARSGTVTQGGGLLDFNKESPAAYINIYLGDGGDISPASNTETDYDRMLDDLFKNGDRQPIGSIALTPKNLDIIMPEIPVEDTPTYEVQTYATAGNKWEDYYSEKVPMVIASLRLKTEQGSNNVGATGASASRQWLNNGITNTYAVNGFANDQDLDSQNMQYELTWEPMTDWLSAPAIEHTEGVAYGGTGHTAQDGVSQAVVCQIPFAPYSSISQFSHAPINKSGIAPLTTQIIGNSFASPVFSRDQKQANYDNLTTSYLDHSYLANSTLFDEYFISTAVNERDVPIGNDNRTLTSVTTEFFTGVEKLHNSNYEPITSTQPNNLQYDNFAAYIYNKGAFNVNSTSVEAWSLLLASAQQDNLPLFNILTGSSTIRDSASGDDNLVAFSRFSPMAGDNYDLSNTNANSSTRWSGVSRRLTTDQINDLATDIVEQVKLRGPFQSLSEFVNRRLESTDLGNSGAIQSAIESSGLNNPSWTAIDAPINNTEISQDSSTATSTGTATSGTATTSDGAPDHLTQADILNKIAPSLTVRGDTFTVRAYGDVRDRAGNITSKAWCEATLQRTHDYVDTAEDKNLEYASLTSLTNQQLGRKFKIVSFRWLSEDEI